LVILLANIITVIPLNVSSPKSHDAYASTINQATAESEIESVLQALQDQQAFGVGTKDSATQAVSRDSFGTNVTNVLAGPPATDIVYFQLFQYTNQSSGAKSPYTNSVQKITSAGHASCYNVAYTAPTSPYWYDDWNTIDTNEHDFGDQQYGTVANFDVLRPWANDNATLGGFPNWTPVTNTYDTDLSVDNLGVTTPITTTTQTGPWASVLQNDNPHGPAFPPGRGPAPHWFQVCLNHGVPIIDSNLQPTDLQREDTGLWKLYEPNCGPSITGVPGEPPLLGCEWAPVEEWVCNPDDPNGCPDNFPPGGTRIVCTVTHTDNNIDPSSDNPKPNCVRTYIRLNYEDSVDQVKNDAKCSDGCIAWTPEVATGIVTTGFQSGGDFAGNHNTPWSDFYQGNFRYNPAIRDTDDCGFTSADPFCTDWENYLWPDAPSRHFASNFTGSNPTDPTCIALPPCYFKHTQYHSNIVSEEEQWLVPVGYRPEPGDRATFVGRLIEDMGHGDDHQEFHPLEAVQSSFLQTGPLERCENYNLTNVTLCPPGTAGMGNLPNISDHWNDYTHGKNAEVTKLVVTEVWQGNQLDFDVFPPGMPDASSRLHWKHEEAYHPNDTSTHQPVDNVQITEYPNHLHVTVTPNEYLPTFKLDTDSPDVVKFADCCLQSRGLAYSFMLWWETPKPIKVTTSLLNDTSGLALQGNPPIAPAGQAIHDITSFNVTDANGHIDYLRYNTPDCSGQATTVSNGTVTNSVAPPSAAFTYTNAGTYSWQALYTNDTKYVNTLSACEPVKVVSIHVTKQFVQPNTVVANSQPSQAIHIAQDSNGNYLVQVVLTTGTKKVISSTNPGQLFEEFNITSDAKNMPIRSITANDTLPINWNFNPTNTNPSATTVLFQAANSTTMKDITKSAIVTIVQGTNPLTGQPNNPSSTKAIAKIKIPDLTASISAGKAFAPGDKILVYIKMIYGIKGDTVDPSKYPVTNNSTAKVNGFSGTNYLGFKQSAGASAPLKVTR